MSSILQDIQTVRSLRKAVRDPKVPAPIIKAIESIHHCIKSGTDLNGWKKVEWRGNTPTARPTTSAPSQKNTAFFTNRQGNQEAQHSAAPAYNYNNRSKNGFAHAVQPKETPASIPLISPEAVLGAVTTSSATSSAVTNAADADNFEVVRRGHWQEKTDNFRPQKYVSKFKKTSDKVEDTILNTILLGKLNKFSQVNYNEIKEFITHIISSGQTEMIKCFMKLVFEKAASEEVFCPLYAKLLSELSASYPVLLTEMTTLYNQYMEIFEEVADGNGENYNELCQRNVEKKYRRGYSQFLAELIKHNVVDTDTFMKIITKIIHQVELNMTTKESIKLNEEFADCLMKITKAIKISKDEDDDDDDIRLIRTTLKKETALRIHPLCQRSGELVGISNKARFTFLDIYENIQKF